MRRPKLTPKVKQGLWMIVARSATVMSAEAGPEGWDKEERQAVLAAARYAEAYWKGIAPGNSGSEEDE
jgi:hypothetical protein